MSYYPDPSEGKDYVNMPLIDLMFNTNLFDRNPTLSHFSHCYLLYREVIILLGISIVITRRLAIDWLYG